MKRYILGICVLLPLILSNCFLPTNSLPAISNSVEKHRYIGGASKHERHRPPEEKIQLLSEECFSCTENDEENLPVKPPKFEEKKEQSLLEKTPKIIVSLVTHPVKEIKYGANLTKNKMSGWLTPIYPGTKWCGVGNTAENDDDLGPEKEADKCCRAHDKCEDYIESGVTKYNLTNKSSFLSLSCECDNALHECLRQANTSTSNSIGYLYFNVLSRKCFIFDYPQKCKDEETWMKPCSEYVTDTSEKKIYQWIPPKKFRKLE